MQLSTGACAFSPVNAAWRTDPVCTSVSTSSSSSSHFPLLSVALHTYISSLNLSFFFMYVFPFFSFLLLFFSFPSPPSFHSPLCTSLLLYPFISLPLLSLHPNQWVWFDLCDGDLSPMALTGSMGFTSFAQPPMTQTEWSVWSSLLCKWTGSHVCKVEVKHTRPQKKLECMYACVEREWNWCLTSRDKGTKLFQCGKNSIFC